MASAPTVNVTTTTNQYLAPKWVDQVLRDNRFFAKNSDYDDTVIGHFSIRRVLRQLLLTALTFFLLLNSQYQ